MSTPTWQEGLAGETSPSERWTPRCSAILSTLLYRHLNADVEQVTRSVWLEEARGVGGNLGQSARTGCESNSVVEMVAASRKTLYSIP